VPRLTRDQLAEITVALVVAAIAGIGYLAVPNMVSGWAFVIPGTTDSAMTPAFFPRVALATTATFALAVAVTAPMRADPLPLLQMTRARWLRFGALFVTSLAYLGGLWLFGYTISSIALILALALLVGYPMKLPMLATAFLLPPIVSWIFWYGLKAQLPAGRFLTLISLLK
jgi:hypothetical protein